MKTHLIIIALLLFGNVCLAQENWQDAIFLKNGSVVRGTIVEQVPNKSIKIQLSNGETYQFEMDKIEKMSKERVNSTEKTKQKNAKPLILDNPDYKRTKYHHMIRMGMSFTPGFMPKHSTGNSYISGDLEYYLANHLSIISSSFFWVNSSTPKAEEDLILQGGKGAVLKMNHQNYSGFRIHILKDKSFDPFIGFQPGFAISQTSDNYNDKDYATYDGTSPLKRHNTNVSFNPMASIDVGFNFYAVKYFHLFVNGRYVMSRHLGGATPYSLNEFMGSFGLGINANFWNKRKKKIRQ